MAVFDLEEHAFVGKAGSLPVAKTDEVTRRFAMLLEGECELGPKAAAQIVRQVNAPHVDQLQRRYQHLPQRLESEGIDPRIPWLYGFKLDFRFR